MPDEALPAKAAGELTSGEATPSVTSGSVTAVNPEMEFQAVVVSRSTEYSGPLPPPQLLQEYERAFPGLGKQIIEQFAGEVAIADMRAQREETKRGQRYGLTVALVGIGTATLMSAWAPVTAAVIGGTTLVGLVTAFVVGRVAGAGKTEPRSDTADRPTPAAATSSTES